MIQKKLKTIRKQKGKSQVQMAKILSTDTSNYSRKERGEVRIHDEEWKKLAAALDVPVEELKEKDTIFSVEFDNSTFHSHSAGNITYFNVPDFFLETQKKYIEKLEQENQSLKLENQLLKENR